MWRYIYHWEKLKIWETPIAYKPKTKISVIIPVRNEAENIESCLHSILSQDYPANLMEVIVINDHSTDQTVSILNKEKDRRLKVLHLADFMDASNANAYKKLSIKIAIDQADGALIITTDGDCIVPKRWLQRIVHLYEQKALKFIAAPVNFHCEKSLLEKFQSLDFVGMMGITGAGIEGQFMNMCNGANLAYDKKTFFEVNGFNGIDHLASGDDMLLMQKIAQRFPNDIGYLKNADARVLTTAQKTWRAFFNQRIRWASKSSDYKEWKVTAMLGIVWLFCWNIFISLVLVYFLGVIGLWFFIGQVLIKAVVDYILLKRMTRFFNRAELMKYFIPSQIIHIFYIVSVGTLSIFIKKYTWKGRSVS